MGDDRAVLSRVLGRTDVIAIGFGTIIGWSWMVMSASWITGAGFLGAIMAFLVGGAVILMIGFMYGELTAAMPFAGGEFVFANRAFGRRMAFVTGWIMVLAYIGVAAWEGIALATALDSILPIPRILFLWEISGYNVHLSWAIVGAAGALAVTLLNLFGIRPAVLFQVMATAAIFVVVLVLFFGGISLGDTENIGELFTGARGFLSVLFLIPAMIIGFDVIPQSAEEMNIEPKEIGRMISVCIIMGILWYCILIVGVGLAAPVEIRTSSTVPTADIAGYLFGNEVFVTVFVIGGILGIFTTWNGFFMGATRLIYAMGRAGAMPSIFGRLSSKNRIPWVAVLFVGFLCMAAPFLGKNALIWLVDTSSVCALAAYALVAMAFVAIRRKEPELDRPFRVRGGAAFPFIIVAFALCYCVADLVFILLEPAQTPEIIILAVWVVLGLLFSLACRGGESNEG